MTGRFRLCLLAALLAAATSAAAKDRRPPSLMLVATLSGGAVLPGPGDPDGSGVFSAVVERDAERLCYELDVDDTWYAMSAHIHAGRADQVDEVLVELALPDADGKASGCVALDKKLTRQLMLAPQFHYVDVHDIKLPGGSVRGQLEKKE